MPLSKERDRKRKRLSRLDIEKPTANSNLDLKRDTLRLNSKGLKETARPFALDADGNPIPDDW